MLQSLQTVHPQNIFQNVVTEVVTLLITVYSVAIMLKYYEPDGSVHTKTDVFQVYAHSYENCQ